MKRTIKAVALFIIGGVALALIGIFLWKFPTHQVQGYRAQIDEKKPFEKDRAEHDREMLKLENELRGNYAQIIGGFVLLVGLYLTWRKQNHEERTANQTLRLTEDGKITERYSKAVELLGSDNLAMRIGGIYALERIARDSQKDHWTVMEALCAFIRDESNKVATTAQAAEQPPTSENGDKQATDSKNDTEQPKLRSDIQIVLTVIGRRSWVDEEKEQGLSLDLSGAHLSGAHLHKAKLSEANLSRADLKGANLSRANLSRADLSEADLTEAKLIKADLSGAKLIGANLIEADLREAFLIKADLIGAKLIEANLDEAKLFEANLIEADLREAFLIKADLIGAKLIEANLIKADLREAFLIGAKLIGAKLIKADLREAFLIKADLRGADLIGANLGEANLGGADLTGADLSGADLTGADLSGADLRGAEYNEKTQFPEGFDLARLKPDTNEGTE